MNEIGNPINVTGSGTNVPNVAEMEWQQARSLGTYNNTQFLTGIASSTTSFTNMYGEKILLGVEVGLLTISIKYKQLPNYTYTVTTGSYPSYSSNPPAKVWKEVYGLKDGRMTLLEVINGKHNPAYSVPESYEFEDEEDKETSKE